MQSCEGSSERKREPSEFQSRNKARYEFLFSDLRKSAQSADSYSGMISPEPPNAAGKSFNFGRPSLIGRTVSS